MKHVIAVLAALLLAITAQADESDEFDEAVKACAAEITTPIGYEPEHEDETGVAWAYCECVA